MNITPQRHSTVVGGSTAARVMACPGSVRLCREAPKPPPSEHARDGSLKHAAIAEIIEQNIDPDDMLGFEHEGLIITQAMVDDALVPAVLSFDKILDELETEMSATAVIKVEVEVSFGKYIPGAFGSCDILARVGDRVLMIDWKFGSGVPVSAENNKQLMFYACAAMRTPELASFFEDAIDIELIIIQPTHGEPTRWLTTFPELARFEKSLKAAVKEAERDSAHIVQGPHCRWCAAQPTCPLMNGAVDIAVKADIEKVDVAKLGKAVAQSYVLEGFIKKVRALVQMALEEGIEVPGCKLVQKRATRKWSGEEPEILKELKALSNAAKILDPVFHKTELLSPAQIEKTMKLKLPDSIVVKESSGTTLALADDPRPAVTNIAALSKALNKIK